MGTYFGFENKNKVTDRSPDYLISPTNEENQGEKRNAGIIYRTKSRNGVEYLKVIMEGAEGDSEARKTYFGFRSKTKRSETSPPGFYSRLKIMRIKSKGRLVPFSRIPVKTGGCTLKSLFLMAVMARKIRVYASKLWLLENACNNDEDKNFGYFYR
jgi:hypothetical protein